MATNKLNLRYLTQINKGYLIGMILGDGYLYHDKWRHYKINIYLNPNNDTDIAKFIISILEKIGVNPYLMHHHGCLIIRFNSKLFFKYYYQELKNIENVKNKDFMIGYISGLIDSDGYVSYGDILISNINKKILETAIDFCEKLDIKTRLSKKE